MIEVVSNFFNKGGSPAEATQQLVAAATQKPADGAEQLR
jgi:hypothetical protein